MSVVNKKYQKRDGGNRHTVIPEDTRTILFHQAAQSLGLFPTDLKSADILNEAYDDRRRARENPQHRFGNGAH